MTLDPLALPLHGRQLIEASAGTGKTWTLSALYLRLLLESALEPRQILVLTYTTAATAELRERIRARLAQLLQRLRRGEPDESGGDAFVEALLAKLAASGIEGQASQRRLQQALQNFDEAPIATLHGFCQRALSELPFTAGVPLALELLEDESELRLQFVHDHWRDGIAAATAALPDAAAAQLAALLLKKNDSPERWDRAFEDVLKRPLARLRWPPSMDEQRPGAASDAELAALVQSLAEQFEQARATWAASRQVISDIVDEARERLHQGYYKPDAVDRAFAEWDRLFAAPGPLEAEVDAKKLSLLGSARLKPTGKQEPPLPHAFFEQAQQLLDTLGLAEREDSPLAARRLWLLRELLEQGPARFAERKRKARLQSFDDIIGALHQRLQGPRGAALAAALRTRWPAALIDEFQDTDPQQAAIFETLYATDAAAPVFMLGDPKQAIYAFRGADLHSYLAQRARAAATHTLAHNQRSTPELLAALNALFAGHARAFVLEGIAYTPVEAGAKPRPRLADAGGHLGSAALQLWQLPRRPDGKGERKPLLKQQLAAVVAEHIARSLALADAGAITLDGRPLAGGDIALLVRSHGEGALLRQALAARGVASVDRSRESVHASAEARELETVLAAFVEPTHATLLHAALATTLLGFDSQALRALQKDEAAQQRLIERCHALHQRWRRRGVGVMLREWLADGVSARLLAFADGERRLTNLLHLVDRLQQREAASPGSPLALLRWLQAERRRRRRAGDDTLLRLESDRQLVQIVTLHRAKGLEYPLVYCPFAWDLTLPPASGLGVEYHDADGQAAIDHRELAKDSVERAQLQLERRAEAMRLLYVGLTRAVHRCWLPVGMWGQGKTLSLSAASRSTLNSLAAGDEMTPEAWLEHRLAPEAIDAAWAELAYANAPHITLAPLPALQPGLRYQPQRPDPEQLSALPGPAQVGAPWTLASFSSLWLDRRHEFAAADHDQLAAAGTDVAADAAVDDEALPADDILAFPRGAAAGVCLHEVFESIDFAERSGWTAQVDATLRRHRIAPGEDALAPLARGVLAMLGNVLDAALPGSAPLSEVPRARQLVELEFCLAAGGAATDAQGRGRGVDLGALQRLMARHGLGEVALGNTRLDGWLRGFIDLVYEHRGRWWIVDWKSNHLGNRADDYGATALQRAMASHGYALQALLYALALHRWLGLRLHGYRPETHFGGVHYLFVRGIRPQWPGAGIHSWRPDAALLQEASALFGEPSR